MEGASEQSMTPLPACCDRRYAHHRCLNSGHAAYHCGDVLPVRCMRAEQMATSGYGSSCRPLLVSLG